VTLQGFQRALCDLIASPLLVRRLWDDPQSALADYPLSAREQVRLKEIARQPGMATSCALYRMNRVTPLYTYLRLSCHALGDALRTELDRFWELQPAHAQFEHEVTHFGAFLRDRVRDGALPPIVEEVLNFELAVNDLRYRHRNSAGTGLAGKAFALHENARIVRLSREPLGLLSALDAREPLAEVPAGEHYVLVLKTESSFDVVPILSKFGRALLAIAEGESGSLPTESLDALLKLGLVVANGTGGGGRR
jgi:hypothetical protein